METKTETKPEIGYSEMMNLYLDGKLLYKHDVTNNNKTNTIHNFSKINCDYTIREIEDKPENEIYFQSKVKYWRIMYNLRLDEIKEREKQDTK